MTKSIPDLASVSLNKNKTYRSIHWWKIHKNVCNSLWGNFARWERQTIAADNEHGVSVQFNNACIAETDRVFNSYEEPVNFDQFNGLMIGEYGLEGSVYGAR